MDTKREEFLEAVKDSFSAYYNIILEELPEDLPIAFRAEYFSRAEKYWISKSIPIWGNETNEYAYIFSAPCFDSETAARCIDFALAEALPKVRPHKEHQYTDVKVVFIADSFDEKTRKAVEKRSFQKSYKMSFHGFSRLHTAAVDLNKEATYTNKAGHALVPYFRKLFASRKESA